jgi:hypothetical protein
MQGQPQPWCGLGIRPGQEGQLGHTIVQQQLHNIVQDHLQGKVETAAATAASAGSSSDTVVGSRHGGVNETNIMSSWAGLAYAERRLYPRF